MPLQEAKTQLDTVIRKGRVHLYKPMQIAEILCAHRESPNFELDDLESYRNLSKRWRNRVSQRLVGRVCTSSARFQDDLFNDNAMPPHLLAILGQENERPDRLGIVEAYIYRSFEDRLTRLRALAGYVATATTETFDLSEFINGFIRDAGLRRSIDKAYEITVFGLFSTIVRYLGATVTVGVGVDRLDLLEEFEDFTKIVLGLTRKRHTITVPARLYRAGVANAADRGLDMWANFGPAVQIKHVTLDEDIAEDIVSQVTADKIVIVCQNAHRQMIERILTQLGFSPRIQGIITQTDLERWYLKCFSEIHRATLGESLLRDLHREFLFEFPSTGDAFIEFMQERGYEQIEMRGIFAR